MERWLAATRREIPFSEATKRALRVAVEEADSLGQKHVGPEHLLLAVFRDESTQAWRTLQDTGARLREFRMRVEGLQDGGEEAT